MTKLYCFLLLFVASVVRAQSPVPSGAKLEKIATGFQQPEGPVWKDGSGLLFSDIQRSTIYQWSQTDSIKIFFHPSDSSNGLTLDRQGRLILTQMLSRRVARQELNGTITPLVSTFNGKKFNSPNDVVVKSDGSIFFTDPDFNIPGGAKNKELTFQGIYRISPSGTLSLLDSSLNKPNGICFSLDEKMLFVNESALDKIYVWDVVNDSTLTNKRLFYTIPGSRPNTDYVDGMKIDTAGNIYCTGPTGIWIVSPTEVLLGKIAVPVAPSNCNWGDADRKTLYITGGNSLYRIRIDAATSVKDHGSITLKTFELYGNFPNPFNPATVISYQLPVASNVLLHIFDFLGREVAVLVNDIRGPGTYSVTWNAIGFSSGIYLYSLTSSPIDRTDGNIVTATKKLILLK
jgi:gluconolactonase